MTSTLRSDPSQAKPEQVKLLGQVKSECTSQPAGPSIRKQQSYMARIVWSSSWSVVMRSSDRTTRDPQVVLTSRHEADVLAAIRKLAVHEKNTTVARVVLHDMIQDRDEPNWAFGVHICGQAQVLIKCTHCAKEVNYTDEVLTCTHPLDCRPGDTVGPTGQTEQRDDP